MNKYSQVFSSEINVAFTFIIIAIVLFAVICRVKNKFFSFQEYAPTATSAFGIFGTFWGIFLGLLEFDTNEISKSIPMLLDGMKTAFYTSVIGMLATIVLKFFYVFFKRKKTVSNDPVDILNNVARNIAELNQTLGKCFRSDEEYSLVSQVKLIRQEMIDGRKEIKQALKEFGEQFAQMASASLIEQLEKVVDKFNAMLSDLVSESFKELTTSTINLNNWQQEYREIIITDRDNLIKLYDQFATLSAEFENVEERMEKATSNFKDIDETLNNVDKNLVNMADTGRSLANNTQELYEHTQSLTTAIDEIRKIGEEAKQVIPTLHKKQEDLINNFTSLSNDITRFTNEITYQLSSNIQRVQDSISNNVQRNQETLSSNIQQTEQDLASHVSKMEQQLQETLTNSMNRFAAAMVSISNQFATDYQPLTQRLREILNIAASIRKQ